MYSAELYIALQTIERRKREAGIHPCHSLRVVDIFKELKKHSHGDIDVELRRLLDEGKIRAGRTVNDTWIKLV